MFVITAIDGHSIRNERSLSSASATMYSPRPSRAPLPNAFSLPPITASGSRPLRSSTNAIIDVVVVLPCAPATAIEKRIRINSASISARGITGTPRRLASTTSGLVGRTADETTTTSASPTFAAACPSWTATRKPAASLRVASDPLRSDPLTSYPRFASSSAIPLMPLPPIPTKCTRRVLPSKCQYPVDDHSGRVRPCHAPGRIRHLVPQYFVSCQCTDFRGQPVAGEFPLLDQSRRTLLDQRHGVLSLVIVGRGRQRDQNRRLARRGQLRQRRRAGA